MTAAFSILVAIAFILIGSAKVAAVAPMHERAAHLGFDVSAYRVLGIVELTGAVGLLAGLAVPVVGLVAALGLVLLLVGALVIHLRTGDGIKELIPALTVGAATVLCSFLLLAEVTS